MGINDLNYCPICKSQNIKNILNPKSQGSNISTRKWFCPDCGFDLYCNIAAAVGLILYDDEQNVLFEVRAKEPRKGFIVIPGGFVDADERAEEAVLREAREEIGLEISEKDLTYLTTFPNTYEYKSIVYKTCDMFFSAKLPKGQNMHDLISKLSAEETEVTEIQIHKVTSEKDIDNLPLAFVSGEKALKAWFKKISD